MLDDDKAPIAEFKNLKVVFETKDGTVTGVEDVSFSIYPGETVCVVGESGSGKSVTAMSILQLLPRPQASYSKASSIKFKGDEIIDAPNNKLLNIRGNIVSMVFQEPMTCLNPTMTIGDQIVEVILNHKKILIKNMICFVKGYDLFYKLPFQFCQIGK